VQRRKPAPLTHPTVHAATQDGSGYTALHCAAAYRETVLLGLLQAGANANARTAAIEVRLPGFLGPARTSDGRLFF